MPATDQDEAVVAAGEGFPQPRGVNDQRFRREFDSARTCFENLRDAGLQRTEVDAVRCGLEPVQGQAVGICAEPSPYGPSRSIMSRRRSWPGPAGEQRGQFVDRTSGHG